MTNGTHPSPTDPLASVGSWTTKTLRVRQQPTTVVETGDASAAIVALTSVAAGSVVAAVLWRRFRR